MSETKLKDLAFKHLGPGKFSDTLDRWTWEQTLDGCCDTVGDVQELGHYSKVVFEPDEQEVLTKLEDEDGLLVFGNEPVVGAIVMEDSQGFVAVTYYDNKERFEADWESAHKDCEAFNEPDPFDPN